MGTSYRRAIADSVSPGLTTCSRVAAAVVGAAWMAAKKLGEDETKPKN